MENTIFETIYNEVNKLIEEGAKNGTGFEDDYESEVSIRMIVSETCKKHNIDEDNYWKWMLHKNKSNFKKKVIVKNNYNREEVKTIFREGVRLGKQIQQNLDYYSLSSPVEDWINQNLK
jgi:hypothetical protein